MGEENYIRLGRRWRRARGRGFKLNASRFSVRRLRGDLFAFFGLLGRCVRSLMRRLAEGHSSSNNTRVLVGCGTGHGHMRCSRCGGGGATAGGGLPHAVKARKLSYMRSNSFYAEAIADCLEFIKRNSVPIENYNSGYSC